MLFSRWLKVRYIGPASMGRIIVKAKSGEVRVMTAIPSLMKLMTPGDCYALSCEDAVVTSFKEMPNAQLPY